MASSRCSWTRSVPPPRAAERLPIPGTVIIESRADAERAARTLEYPSASSRPSSPRPGRPAPRRKPSRWRRTGPARGVRPVAAWAVRSIAQERVPTGGRPLLVQRLLRRDSRPLVTFVARKLRQRPPHTGTSSLGEECRNDEVLRETAAVRRRGYRGLAYLEMKRTPARAATSSSSRTSARHRSLGDRRGRRRRTALHRVLRHGRRRYRGPAPALRRRQVDRGPP